jgi:Ca2+-binding EF-hand superfamily protein
MQISSVGLNYGAIFGGPAGASSGGKNRLSQLASDQFSALDTNGDGVVSQDELKAALTQLASSSGSSGSVSNDRMVKLFKKIDADGDGKISSSEWSTFQQKVQSFQQQGQSPLAALVSKQFSALDTNGDGVVSQEELKAAMTQASLASSTTPTDDKVTSLFKKVDADGDGKISSSEWTSFQQRTATMGHHHHHHASGGEGADQGTSLISVLQNLVSKLYQTADKSGDGLLSPQELTDSLQQVLGGAVNVLG